MMRHCYPAQRSETASVVGRDSSPDQPSARWLINRRKTERFGAKRCRNSFDSRLTEEARTVAECVHGGRRATGGSPRFEPNFADSNSARSNAFLRWSTEPTCAHALPVRIRFVAARRVEATPGLCSRTYGESAKTGESPGSVPGEPSD